MKMESNYYDFVVELPKTQKGYDSIWVIVNRLTKSVHFVPIQTIYTLVQYAQLYIQHIVSLYGVPMSIISDRGIQFTLRFWQK